MFSGIVAELGNVADYDGRRLSITAPALSQTVKVSESVAVNGVCLTVVEVSPVANRICFELSPETKSRSTLSSFRTGRKVNLEPALRYQMPVGGHLVQGHIDGTAKVVRIGASDNSQKIQIELEQSIIKYVVEKGFITIDGVSLTVNSVDASNSGGVIEFMIVPYTFEHTVIGTYRVGTEVNIEVDYIAKYIEKYIERDNK